MDALERGEHRTASGMEAAVREAIEIKLSLLAADPFEADLRRVLNLGHCVGHPLEVASHYGLRHGEAVSVGLVVAAEIARLRGLCAPATADRIRDVLERPRAVDALSVAAGRRGLGPDGDRAPGPQRRAEPRGAGGRSGAARSCRASTRRSTAPRSVPPRGPEMRLALASTAYSDLPLADAADRLAHLGLDAIELAVDTRARLCDVDALLDAGERRAIQRLLAERGLDVVALANHDDGQLVLGPHHAVTDGFYRGTPEEKRAYGIRRMKDTARAADALGVRLVAGFTGCPDYARWFHWHDQAGWEANYEALADDWSEILDVYREYGVRFAHELHPKQVVYEPVGARMSLELFAGYDEWGFSFDTANLMLAGVDPVAFAREFAPRIFYVHAKDAEVVEPTTREHFIARPATASWAATSASASPAGARFRGRR